MDARENKYKELVVRSPAFRANESIPQKYTCEGNDINPPLDIDGIPDAVKSLALIVDDPDAPGRTWLHWTVWNIPVTHQIQEGKIPGEQGLNDFGNCSYGGPCPPIGTHRYFFKVYGLDVVLDLQEGASLQAPKEAMGGHILAYGALIGLYKKTKR